ncbi:hypothetical protein HWV62_27174 [Athelia sp. TMB]|nr:hypothetical protein HWV62_27174 [Athelia sp. TMB]
MSAAAARAMHSSDYDTTLQSTLPPEILFAILDAENVGLASLQSFRLTCKLYAQVARPAMFRSLRVAFETCPSTYDDDRLHFWTSPTIAPLVFQCEIRDLCGQSDHTREVPLILKRLHLLVNLKSCSLSMLQTPIDDCIMTQLRNLQYLNHLSIHDCILTANNTTPLRIASISVDHKLPALADTSDGERRNWGTLLDTDHIRSIVLRFDENLTQEDTLQSIFDISPVPNLDSFSITAQPELSTLRILTSSPPFTSQLRELRLLKANSPTLGDEDFHSPVHLPFLHTYTGPCNAFRLFKSGNALRTVHLGKATAPSICTVLEGLSRSSNQLEELWIMFDQVTARLLDLICSKFPRLTKLLLEHSRETQDTGGSYTPENVTVIYPLHDPLVFWDNMCFPDMDMADEEVVAEHLFRTCNELWEVRLWIRSDLLWKRSDFPGIDKKRRPKKSGGSTYSSTSAIDLWELGKTLFA